MCKQKTHQIQFNRSVLLVTLFTYSVIPIWFVHWPLYMSGLTMHDVGLNLDFGVISRIPNLALVAKVVEDLIWDKSVNIEGRVSRHVGSTLCLRNSRCLEQLYIRKTRLSHREFVKSLITCNLLYLSTHYFEWIHVITSRLVAFQVFKRWEFTNT